MEELKKTTAIKIEANSNGSITITTPDHKEYTASNLFGDLLSDGYMW